jgi:hypothetical protein
MGVVDIIAIIQSNVKYSALNIAQISVAMAVEMI